VAFLVIALSVTSTSAWAYPLVTGEGLQGTIQGTVYAKDRYGEYTSLYWVTVTASNAKYNFTTSTDGNGFYAFSLPIGTYNLTAQAGFHGFICYAYGCSRTLSTTVTVNAGSTSLVDFDFTWQTAGVIT
jgi:hypothetical protein